MKQVRWGWWIAALLFLLFVVRFHQLTAYFLVAVALSFTGRPLVGWVAHRNVAGRQLGHGIGAFFALTLMASMAFGVMMLFAPLVQEQIEALGRLNAKELTEHWNNALVVFDGWTSGIDLSGEGMANSAYLAEQATSLLHLDSAGNLFTEILSSLGNIFVALFSIVFMTFFLMREPDLFQNLVLKLAPASRETAMRRILERSGQLLTRYFGGLVIQISIVTVILGLGLSLIGIPHGWLLGLLGGLFNLIPYIGPILGVTVGALVMISSGVNWVDFAWGMGVYLAANAVDNVFTQPVIFAKRVYAHPLEIFVVISIAGSLAGAAGMVLAIPAYTLFRIVAREFLQEFSWAQALTKSMDDRENARD